MSTDTPITDRMIIAPEADGNPVIWLPTTTRYGTRSLAPVADRYAVRQGVVNYLTDEEREEVTQALWQRLTAGIRVAPKCAHPECPEYAIEHPTRCADHERFAGREPAPAGDETTGPALEATLAMPTLAEWHDDITRQLNESDEAQDWPMAAGTPVNLRLDHDTRTVALAPFEDDTEQEDGR